MAKSSRKMINHIKLDFKLIFLSFFAIFRCFGLCPIKFSSGSKTFNLLLLIWSLFHFAAVGVLTFFIVKKFIESETDIANFNNILTSSSFILTYFIVILESIFVRNNLVKIWSHVATVDDIIDKMIVGYDQILFNFYKKSSIKIITYIIMTFILELSIIINIANDRNWTFMWSVCILPLTVSRLKHLQYMLYVDVLTCRFRVIKNELKAIAAFTGIENDQMLANDAFYDGIYCKISGIKKVYNTLWESSQLINKSFGISQIANFLQNFVQMTCDLYVMYAFLNLNDMTYIIGELKGIIGIGVRDRKLSNVLNLFS